MPSETTPIPPEQLTVYSDRISNDEQLIAALLEREHELVESFVSSGDNEYRKYFDNQIASTFPMYRYLIGRTELDRCINQILSSSNTVKDKILSLQIEPGSLVPAPNWKIPSNNLEINGLVLSNFGRVYLFKALAKTLTSEQRLSTFHTIVVMNTAYIFPNFETCNDKGDSE